MVVALFMSGQACAVAASRPAAVPARSPIGAGDAASPPQASPTPYPTDYPTGPVLALAVSVASTPTQIRPGASADLQVRVLNPATEPVTVTLRGRGIDLADNGVVRLLPGTDPTWTRNLSFPDEIHVPGQGFATANVRVTVPAETSPDLYFIGFVVTPRPVPARGVKVINQIGSFLTLDVPGPRTRQLRARLFAPPIQFRRQARATLTVQNTGHATSRFWGETSTSSPGTTQPDLRRIEPTLLPAQRSRTLPVRAQSGWPIALLTITTHLTYPQQTDTQTTDLTTTRRILLIQPTVPPATLAVLLGLLGLTWRRRRRLPSPTTPPSDTERTMENIMDNTSPTARAGAHIRRPGAPPRHARRGTITNPAHPADPNPAAFTSHTEPDQVA